MNHIQGIDRFQVTFSSLEDGIAKDNPVRVIDAFIDKLDLDLLGFVAKPNKPEQEPKQPNPHLDGRPSFELKVFLKSTSMDISMGSAAAEDLKKNVCEISKSGGSSMDLFQTTTPSPTSGKITQKPLKTALNSTLSFFKI